MVQNGLLASALRPFLLTYDVWVNRAVGVSAGCFLFIRKSLPLSELAVTTDMEGRFILWDFLFSAGHWWRVCIYAPSVVKDRVSFFYGLRRFLDCERTIVLLGDFNIVARAIDRKPRKQRSYRSQRIH